MRLNTDALAQLKFRTKGKWYDGRQVDAFIDELTVAAAEWERELTAGECRCAELQEENERLREELLTMRAQAESPETLTQERERLLSDIKALRAFRERFRVAVEQDVEEFSRKAKQFASEELLK